MAAAISGTPTSKAAVERISYSLCADGQGRCRGLHREVTESGLSGYGQLLSNALSNAWLGSSC